MGEKAYKPRLKEGQHLVRSRDHEECVRGVAYDSKNKNPDILEWEEVEIEPEVLVVDPYETERAKIETFYAIINCVDSGLKFLINHPEIIEGMIKTGAKVKNGIVKGAVKAKDGVRALFSRKETNVISIVSVKKARTSTSNRRVENMSIDEARGLVIGMLADYIGMKQKLERLSNARVNGIEMPEIEINQVVGFMESIVQKYPALLDDSNTVLSITSILSNNSNKQENRLICDALKM